MSNRKTLLRVTATCLLASQTACYTARPLATGVPAPATRVRAELTDSGTVAMGGLIGPGALSVEGLVSSADANAWSLSLTSVEHRDGRRVRWGGETVRFPRLALTAATEKRIDKPRSVLAAGLILSAAVVASYMFTSGGSDTGSEGGPIPPASRIPVSIPFR